MKKEVWLIKVGTSERPASPEDIENVKKEYQELFERNVSLRETVDFVVTHHAVEVSVFQKDDENYNLNTKTSNILLLYDKGLISKKTACRRLGLDPSECL